MMTESTESTMTINEYGSKFWKTAEGKFHREDGPAIEYHDGDKEWYFNGFLHREDGPAIDWDGKKFWYRNGLYHREDGPAVEWDDLKEWHLYGAKFTKEDFNSKPVPFFIDDRGYGFFLIGDRIRAGCRNYTIAEALEHWGSPEYEDPERGKKICEAIKKVLDIR